MPERLSTCCARTSPFAGSIIAMVPPRTSTRGAVKTRLPVAVLGFGSDDRLLRSEGALGRVDRDDLVARLGVADDRRAVLEDVEARAGRAVRQHAGVELTGRLVDAAEAGLLGVGHPDAAVVEVGLAHDLALAAGGHPDEQARDEGDDDGGDDPDPSLGGGGAHAFPCSATAMRSSTLFSSSGGAGGVAVCW